MKFDNPSDYFLSEALRLTPELHISTHHPLEFHPEVLLEKARVTYDFGTHYVGHLCLKLGYQGSHPDAPALLRIRFAEREIEFAEDPEAYHGWISKGWIQSEQVHVDILPSDLHLPRRYAFRYVQIEVLAASAKYAVTIEDITAMAQTSANETALRPFACADPLLVRMDTIAVRTLRECMQLIFEDGPKRDRRLWLGDLRLQALANYETYHDMDLVKRCLYLFAGTADKDGRLPAAVFTEPTVEPDDVQMFDYALLFIPTLADYHEAGGDAEAVRALSAAAWRQIELAKANFDENDLIRDSDKLGWCFLDWNLELNKQAGAQGVYLYALKAAVRLARSLGMEEMAQEFREEYDKKKKAALRYLWDAESGLFISGAAKQKSLASQIWMILGGAVEGEEASLLLSRLEHAPLLKPVTPYMMHHYVEAAILCGRKDLALDMLKRYWGKMAEEGADTFWELYDPEDPSASPYGGTIVNSFCHAWSCAPAYFLRKYHFA